MEVFRPIYDELHKWSTILSRLIQDYLVYAALMVSAGVYDRDVLLEDLKQNGWRLLRVRRHLR